MLQKMLKHGGFVLLLLTFGQCNFGKRRVEDITKWKLVWEEEARQFSLIGSFDITPEETLVCHVPSEKSTYCLAKTSECWRFTTDGELKCEQIANLSGEACFVFPAGPSQAQALHAGLVSGQQVTIKKYQNDTWQDAGSCTLNNPATSTAPTKGTACSIREGEQLNGLIFLRQENPGQPSVTLIYDAASQTLEPSTTWECKEAKIPTAAMQMAPDKVLLNHQDGRILILDKENKLFSLSTGKKSKKAIFFMLKGREHMKRAMLAFYIEGPEGTELELCTLMNNSMQSSADLPIQPEEDDEQETDQVLGPTAKLVVPFTDKVYVLTQQSEQPITYYEGSIQDPKKQKKAKK